MVHAQTLPGFYVYTHARGDTGEVFYVGKGRGRRHLARDGRNKLWARIANKHGFSAVIVADNLPEDQAFAMEREMIAQHRGAGAFLANLTDGGEGPAGRVFSDETKEKMRIAKLGRALPAEHRAKIGLAHLGMKRSEAQKAKMRGRQFSPKHRERLSRAHMGRKMHPNARAALARARKLYVITDRHRAAISAKSAGTSNPHHNPEILTFSHPEHGMRICTQCELRLEFGLPHANLSRVVSGQRNMVHGWTLIRRGGQ